MSFVFLNAVVSIRHKENSSRKTHFLLHPVQNASQASQLIDAHKSFEEILINFDIKSAGFKYSGSLSNIYLSLSKFESISHALSTASSL